MNFVRVRFLLACMRCLFHVSLDDLLQSNKMEAKLYGENGVKNNDKTISMWSPGLYM